MATLTYVKGLPTPVEELNSLGFTQFEMFLAAYCPVFHKAACETANHLRVCEKFNKGAWNTYLQTTYSINKRHANGVITFAQGAVDAAKENRKLHIETLEGKLKSITEWIKDAEKKLAQARKFYGLSPKPKKETNKKPRKTKEKRWKDSKTGCVFPLSCSLQYRDTNWQNLRFQIHNKKRRFHKLFKQIEHLKKAPIQVSIPRNQTYVVGSKDESFGNQVCQWDGEILKVRVPKCLENQFGESVQTRLGNFERNINRLPKDGAKTWHFFYKNGHWNAAVQFTPVSIPRVSRHSSHGCIGIDLNPGSIGWAYADRDGNLKAHGQIPLEMGLPSGQQKAQIVRACLQLVEIAALYACPIACEDLDFSAKKEQLKEKGRKYAKMLSGWAYSQFFKSLERIAANRGICILKVNPAYTSLIGLIKYARQYGLASDEAAGLAVARRGMRLSEKIIGSITAYPFVKTGKHVWSQWNQLNTKIKVSSIRRHDFYAISNWESLVKQWFEQSNQSKSKCKT